MMESQWDKRTQLTATPYGLGDYTTSMDVYWYAHSLADNPDALAVVNCEIVKPSDSTRCNHFRMRFKNTFRTDPDLTPLAKNAACHEIGHTVGFKDGGTARTSCMDGGDNSKITDWEITIVNNNY